MDGLIKKIEDMSLNAWPSHKMELYDGWILRFSGFYTHRTNSVEQFAPSVLPWREKIPYCEQEYRRLGTPAVFKISPLVTQNFDFMLENRGYEIQHVTNVMTLDLEDAKTGYPTDQVVFLEGIPEEWIHSLSVSLRLPRSSKTADSRRISKSAILHSIPNSDRKSDPAMSHSQSLQTEPLNSRHLLFPAQENRNILKVY